MIYMTKVLIPFTKIMVLGFGVIGNAIAATTVTFTSQQLQNDFVASTTTQWVATVKPGLFSGDYKISISSRSFVPESQPSDILSYIVGRGMDYERYSIVQVIRSQKSEYLRVSTNTACSNIYDELDDLISQRWDYIYSPTGVVIAP